MTRQETEFEFETQYEAAQEHFQTTQCEELLLEYQRWLDDGNLPVIQSEPVACLVCDELPF